MEAEEVGVDGRGGVVGGAVRSRGEGGVLLFEGTKSNISLGHRIQPLWYALYDREGLNASAVRSPAMGEGVLFFLKIQNRISSCATGSSRCGMPCMIEGELMPRPYGAPRGGGCYSFLWSNIE